MGIQLSAAKLLGEVSKDKDSKFTLAIGDNFYFWGVDDIYDRRWYTTWEKVYNSQSLMKPWYVIAGNHDWQGNITAQIEYSKYNQRWTFPNFYYTITYDFNKNQKFSIIMLDTQMLCDKDATAVNKQYPLRVTDEMREAQLAWLEQELESTKHHDFVFVSGHYQIHTPDSKLKCMTAVDDLIKKYKVTAFINGHQHDQLHLVAKDESKMNYLETGIGSLTSPQSTNGPYENQEVEVVYFFKRVLDFSGGCAMVEVKNDEMVMNWYYEKFGISTPQHSVRIPARSFDKREEF